MCGGWKLWVLAAAALAVAGCSSIQGTWTLRDVTPESAREQIKLAKIELNEDGTYTAESQYGGQTRDSTGTYEFADGTLTLTSSDGGVRTYEAKVTKLGFELQVVREYDGETVTATMKRD